MKKIAILMLAGLTALIFACNPVVTKAQTGIQLYRTSSVNGTIDSSVFTQNFDTLINTTVKYMVSKAKQFDGIEKANYTLSFYAKSLTGTPAVVKMVWEGSFNGYDWFKMTNAYGTDGLNCDTLSFTPSTTATQYKFTSIPGSPKLVTAYAATPVYNMGCRVFYQRLRCIPSGTQKLRIYSFSIFSFL